MLTLTEKRKARETAGLEWTTHQKGCHSCGAPGSQMCGRGKFLVQHLQATVDALNGVELQEMEAPAPQQIHILAISPIGEVHGLQKSTGIPLTALGRARIKRVSEILWDEARQAWFVQFLSGPLEGRPVTFTDCAAWGVPTAAVCTREDDPVFYDKYEEAVALEVSLVESASLRGSYWGWADRDT